MIGLFHQAVPLQLRMTDNAKGKIRANSEAVNQQGRFHANNSTPTSAFPSRFIGSASRLFRDSFSPPGLDATTSLSRALAEGGKGEASSRATLLAANASHSKVSGNKQSKYHGHNHGSLTIRAEASANNNIDGQLADLSLDDFLRQDCFESVPNFEGRGLQGDLRKRSARMDVAGIDGADLSSACQSASSRESHQRSVIETSDDGAEVVNFLSSSHFQPELWTDLGFGDEKPYTISAREQEASQLFLKQFDSNMIDTGALIDAMAAPSVGQPFQELASIFDDIDNYQEVVWGYIRPRIEAAKVETQSSKASVTADGPALTRLKMLLSHLADST